MKKILCLIAFFMLSHTAFASRPFEEKRGVIEGGYNFWVYTPKDYEEGGHPLPLIIFLHGASLCGNNMERVLRYGTLDAIEKGKKIPMLVAAPQNPGGAWKPSKLNDILEYMEDHYEVDTTRIYVLGMSLGGYGTMDFVGTYPEKIAAAMALCGGCSLKDVQGLGKVPLWIMHGTADRAVSVQQSKVVVDKLQKAQNDHLLRYDWIKGGSHGLLARIFYMQKAYDWLIAHSLKDNPKDVDKDFDITNYDFQQTYNDLKIESKMYDDD